MAGSCELTSAELQGHTCAAKYLLGRLLVDGFVRISFDSRQMRGL